MFKYKLPFAFALCVMCGTAFGMSAQAQTKPELYLQSGHKSESFGVQDLLLTPDGRTLVSVAENETKFWDVMNGLELRTLPYGVSVWGNIALSVDGKRLAVAGKQSVRLYDVATGERAGTFGVGDSFAAFGRDGATLYTADKVDKVSVYNLADQKLLRSFRFRDAVENDADFRFAISPDETMIASGRSDTYPEGQKSIELHDLKTGKRLAVLSGHAGAITRMAFSPDGKLLASGGYDDLIKLWDVATGKEVRTIKGHETTVTALAFGPDGKTIISSSRDNSVREWDAASGRELRKFVTPTGDWKTSSDPTYTSLYLSRDAQTLVGGTDTNGSMKLWDVKTGAETHSFQGRNAEVWALAFSSDGKMIASGDKYSSLKLWERATGVARRVDMKAAGGGNVQTAGGMKIVAFSPDNKKLLTVDFQNTLRLIDVVTGAELFKASRGSSVEAIAYSPNGLMVASSTFNGGIEVLEAATGRSLHRFAINAIGSSSGSTLAFSRDGKLLATAGEGDAIALWNLASGQQVQTLKGARPVGVAFSPDGTQLVSLNFSHETSITMWDIASAQPRKIEIESLNRDDFPQTVTFSPDGKFFATGGYAGGDQGTVRLYEAASGKLVAQLLSQKNTVRAVGFSPDGKTLVSASLDGTIKIWDVAAKQELASLIGLDERDWMVVTPDGLFDGSPAAWNQGIWRFSPQLYDVAPIEAYFTEFYSPGLLSDLLGGRRPKAAQSLARKDRRQPRLRVATSGERGAGRASVQISIDEAPAGAQDVRLFRNGSLVKVWHGDVLGGKTNVTLDAQVPIIAGENQLKAYAFNRDNVKSPDAALTITGAESLRRKGIAYVLAVGVNSYANKDFDLKYAVADAEDFGREWQTQQAKLQTFAGTEIVSLKDRDATKVNILKYLDGLKAKVKPEDAVVIYFAGHGTAQQNRFYLIPHDLGYAGARDSIDDTGLQAIVAHSVSDLELQAAVEQIDAGQLLMVIDACNSGQALESEEKRRGPMNSKGLAQLAYEKGMYILTAAQSYQAAQEASRLGHGFLTFALVEEGIKQTKADDEPQDGRVVTREWFDYAARRVPQLQVELMKEAQGGRGVKVAFVKGEEQIEDPAARNVQRPRVFYRRELEAQPLVVARP